MNSTTTRPEHPVLAQHYDRAIRRGAEVRHADDHVLTIWERPRTSLLVVVLFWTLVILSFGLALIFGAVVALDSSGTLTTYTVKRSGRVAKRVQRGVK